MRKARIAGVQVVIVNVKADVDDSFAFTGGRSACKGISGTALYEYT